MVVNLVEFLLLRDLRELFESVGAELGGLSGNNFLHVKEIPVGPDAAEHVIEEVVEVLPQTVPHVDYIVSQRNLVLLQISSQLSVNPRFPCLDVLQALLNFFLQRLFEVQFVH